ncbi:hypothetical protein A9C19_01260 [Bacillus weihaiensis]|uniref:Uncharacterized protein n=1 Tax=Bacillus weihaiensis TaxID=1547283 RepID=A0A1L3MMC1_9BACI|nr:hypothetical protein A9C19_01260 [Bacillus weihaiensis]
MVLTYFDISVGTLFFYSKKYKKVKLKEAVSPSNGSFVFIDNPAAIANPTFSIKNKKMYIVMFWIIIKVFVG